MNFTELNLHENLLKGITEAGFQQCTPVQDATFTHTLKKKDVCVQSQTGTGKTGAFLISIFELLLKDETLKDKKTLIIVPTRELAVQIEKEAKLLGKYLKFKIGSVYGGVGYTEQEAMLKKGLDIIVGTPGRLIDFSEQKKLKFQEIRFLIIDEADRLFDMGFLPDIQRMIHEMPKESNRTTMLFSATLNTRVRNLAWKYMNDPAEVEISPECLVVEKIDQEIYHVGKNEKISLLIGILKRENPNNAIIFTNMKRTAHEVCKRLEHNGFECQYIMGDLPQSKRLKIIEDVKSGKIQLLVATEVAARGLHIDDLNLVINYDLPEDCENYVHRIGRTARAGKSGKAISLACEKYVLGLEAIESFTKYKIPVALADENLFVKDTSKGIYFSIDKPNKGRKVKERTLNRPHKGNGPVHKKRINNVIEIGNHKKSESPTKQYSKTTENKRHQTSSESNSTNRIHKDVQSTTKQIPQLKRKKIILNIFSFLSLKRKQDANVNVKKIKAVKKGTVDERMEYYKKKYGANFIPGPELLQKEIQKQKKPGRIKRSEKTNR